LVAPYDHGILGIRAVERITIVAAAYKHNLDYLKTKSEKMTHLLFEGKK
jgi:GTP cyclohydrolase II